MKIHAAATLLLFGTALIPLTGSAQGPPQVVKDYGLGNLLGGLVQVSDGTFFGVLGDDGNNFPPPPPSFIFHLLPDGTSQNIVSFPADGSLGLNPNALIQASDGNLYGTTNAGGDSNNGVIFRVSAARGFQILHRFAGSDGSHPLGRLVQAVDGHLYGATASGGASGNGTLFRIDLSGRFHLLFSFSGSDGATPNGNLVFAGTAFYGTTVAGGSAGNGTVYRFDPPTGVTTLHDFTGVHGCPNPLTLRRDGRLYGTTADISSNCFATGYGSIFTVDPVSGHLSSLYSFTSHPDGAAFPAGPLLAASDGKLYGSTSIGGPSLFSVGSLFAYLPEGALTTVDFAGGTQGGSPCCELLQSIDGPLYGVTTGFTSIEGNSPDSVVYTAAPSLPAPPPVIQGFKPQSGKPGATVLLQGDHLLGVTQVTFNNLPARFQVTSTGALYTVVPAGAATGEIVVQNPGGFAHTGPFTVQ